MRQLVFPSGPALGFLTVQVEIFILMFLSVAFVIGAYYLLAYMERLAIQQGRLTESRR
jgi:ABC-2 type transport system permease protein